MTTRLSTSNTRAGGLPQRDDMRRWLRAIGWGLDAQAVADAGVATGDSVLIILPIWEQHRGRESRVRWSSGTIAVAEAGGSITLQWRHTEGDDIWHEVDLAVSVDAGLTLISGQWPAGAAMATGRAGTELSALISEGEIASWEMLQAMEPFVHSCVERAGRWISTEIGMSAAAVRLLRDNGSVVDGIAADNIVTGMLYGQEEGTDNSVVLRMIHSYLADASDRVALTYYLERNMRARCEERVRQVIGDPGLGPLIRRVRATLPDDATAEDVLNACRRAGVGGGKLSLPRVILSLTVAHRVHTVGEYVGVPTEDELSDPRAANDFEQVDNVELIRSYRTRTGVTEPDRLWLSWNLEMSGRSGVPVMDRDRFYEAARALRAH